MVLYFTKIGMAFFSKCTFKLERTSKQIHSGSVIIILLKYPDVDKSRELYVNDDVHLSFINYDLFINTL